MEELNALSERVIGLAIQVHSELGPGFLEKIIPVHEAQLLTYLKHKNIKLGLLLNFNVKLLKEVSLEK